MRIEHGLILSELGADRLALGCGRPVRIGGGRRTTEPHQTCHQQQARLGRGQVAAADERIDGLGKAFVIAASDPRHRQAAVNRAQQSLVTRPRRRSAVGRKTFEHEARQRRVSKFVVEQRQHVDLAFNTVVKTVAGIVAVFDDGDFWYCRIQQGAAETFDRDFDLRQPPVFRAPHAHDLLG